MLQLIEGQVELLVGGAPLSGANPVPVTFSAVSDQGVHFASGPGSALGTPLFASVTNFPTKFDIGNGGLGTAATPLVVSGTTFTPPADQGTHIASGVGFAATSGLFVAPATGADFGVHLNSGAGTVATNPLFVAIPDTTVTGTINTFDATGGVTGNPTAGSYISETLPSSSTTVGFEISGTWSGTLQFEVSEDGASWYSLATRAEGGLTDVIYSVQSNGIYRGDVAAERFMRIRASAWTSGTANITIITSMGAFAINIAGQLPSGNNKLGAVDINQATPGVTNGVVVKDTAGSNAMGAPLVAGDTLLGLHRKEVDIKKARANTIAYDTDFQAVTSSATPFTWSIIKQWTVPGTVGQLLVPQHVSLQNNATNMWNRLVERTTLASFNSAQGYLAGASAVAPEFWMDARLELLVVPSAATTMTITYTNEAGVAGRAGTASIPAKTAVGARYKIALQAGDVGITAIANVTSSIALTAGSMALVGYKEFATCGASIYAANQPVVISPLLAMRPGRMVAFEIACDTASTTTNTKSSFQGYLTTEL